jgi:hypothetical protein
VNYQVLSRILRFLTKISILYQARLAIALLSHQRKIPTKQRRQFLIWIALITGRRSRRRHCKVCLARSRTVIETCHMFVVGAHSIDGQLRDSWCGISGFDSGPWMWEKEFGSGLLLLKIRCVIRDHWCGKSGTHGMGKQVLFPEPLVVQRPESDPGSLVHKTLVCKMPRFGTIGVGNPL